MASPSSASTAVALEWTGPPEGAIYRDETGQQFGITMVALLSEEATGSSAASTTALSSSSLHHALACVHHALRLHSIPLSTCIKIPSTSSTSDAAAALAKEDLTRFISPLRPEYAILIVVNCSGNAATALTSASLMSSSLKKLIRGIDVTWTPSDLVSSIHQTLDALTAAIRATPARFSKDAKVTEPYFLSLPQIHPHCAISSAGRPGLPKLKGWYEKHGLDTLVTCQSEHAEEMRQFVQKVNEERNGGAANSAASSASSAAINPRVAAAMAKRANAAAASSAASSSSSASASSAASSSSSSSSTTSFVRPSDKSLQWFPIPLSAGGVAFLSNTHAQAAVIEHLTSLFARLRQGQSHRALIHCAAGMHRTGMMTYAVLRLSGLTPIQSRMSLHLIRQITAAGVGDDRCAIVESAVLERVAERCGVKLRNDEQAKEDLKKMFEEGAKN